MDTTWPVETTSLDGAVEALMDDARRAGHGRSACTVRGGHDRALRHTVLALRAGTVLHERHSLREATLQVLTGRVRLTGDGRTLDAAAGDLFGVPAAAHDLRAVEDSAVLLTVSLSPGPPSPTTTPADAEPAYSWQEQWDAS